MSLNLKNRFIFHGEIIEVINTAGIRTLKILCSPGSMIIEAPEQKNLELGDHVVLTGTFEPDVLELDHKNPLNN